jgi:hypothetical protein
LTLEGGEEFFFFIKILFARSKYTHFSTGKYKNCSWSTNLPAETLVVRGGHGTITAGYGRYSSEKMGVRS